MEVTFNAGGQDLVVCFTARARYAFEVRTGYSVTKLRAADGRFSDVEVAELVLAGLEGARRRSGAKRKPWTLDEVLDRVLVDADALTAAVAACRDALRAAFGPSTDEPPAEEIDQGKA